MTCSSLSAPLILNGSNLYSGGLLRLIILSFLGIEIQFERKIEPIIILSFRGIEILFERKTEPLSTRREISSFFSTITFFILWASQGLHRWSLDQDACKWVIVAVFVHMWAMVQTQIIGEYRLNFAKKFIFLAQKKTKTSRCSKLKLHKTSCIIYKVNLNISKVFTQTAKPFKPWFEIR